MQTNQPEYYDILKKLRLEGPPIGVKFEFFRPEGLAQLETERPMSFCEMLRCAQREDRAFYFSRENPETCVGKILLGMGCAWLMIHPFQTGKINFVLPAFVHGLHGRELFEPETVLIGIPHQWIPTVIGNMEEMTLELEGHESRAAYYSEFEGILADLGQRAQDP